MSSVADVAKSLVADVFKRGDMDVFDRLFAEDYVPFRAEGNQP